MFYAIEYAYGRNVVDEDGDKIGKVLSFTAKRLRDAWVGDGNEYIDQSGYRENISARDRFVRNAWHIDAGDGDGWKVVAHRRVRNSGALSQHENELMYGVGAEYFRWVATATESELIAAATAEEKRKEDEYQEEKRKETQYWASL